MYLRQRHHHTTPWLLVQMAPPYYLQSSHHISMKMLSFRYFKCVKFSKDIQLCRPWVTLNWYWQEPITVMRCVTACWCRNYPQWRVITMCYDIREQTSHYQILTCALSVMPCAKSASYSAQNALQAVFRTRSSNTIPTRKPKVHLVAYEMRYKLFFGYLS